MYFANQATEDANALQGGLQARWIDGGRAEGAGEHLAGPGDGVAFIVQQGFDPQEFRQVRPPIEALAAGAAPGLHAELALPVAEHVRVYADELRHFADAEVQLVGRVDERIIDQLFAVAVAVSIVIIDGEVGGEGRRGRRDRRLDGLVPERQAALRVFGLVVEGAPERLRQAGPGGRARAAGLSIVRRLARLGIFSSGSCHLALHLAPRVAEERSVGPRSAAPAACATDPAIGAGRVGGADDGPPASLNPGG